MDRKVSIIADPDGRKIVLINDIRFKSRRIVKWADIERYLKEYIGNCYEIGETAEKIYIGSDFPDEFTHSEDTKKLQGGNIKAKANITSALGEIIEIATNRMIYQDFQKKHGKRAK